MNKYPRVACTDHTLENFFFFKKQQKESGIKFSHV